MLQRFFKTKTASSNELRNELNRATLISNELYKINGLKEARIQLLENEIKNLKKQLNSEKEYNELLKSGYESQREKNSHLNDKLSDIRLTDAFQAKYN